MVLFKEEGKDKLKEYKAIDMSWDEFFGKLKSVKKSDVVLTYYSFGRYNDGRFFVKNYCNMRLKQFTDFSALFDDGRDMVKIEGRYAKAVQVLMTGEVIIYYDGGEDLSVRFKSEQLNNILLGVI